MPFYAKRISSNTQTIKNLADAIRKAHLEECVEGRDCGCLTNEEHEKNLAKAKQMGLTKPGEAVST